MCFYRLKKCALGCHHGCQGPKFNRLCDTAKVYGARCLPSAPGRNVVTVYDDHLCERLAKEADLIKDEEP